jgi:flagellar basal body rod protein FlgG
LNYGYNLAAAGVVTAMHRQDVAANNLANIETVGFKMDGSGTIPRAAAREEDGLWNEPSNRLLERLGAGVLLAPTTTRFTQGAIQATGNTLDLAIKGDGFFAVATRGARDASSEVVLTRDGRFTLNQRGELVTVDGGHAVLDAADRPIRLDPRLPVDIDAAGLITQGGQEAGRLSLTDVADRTRLRKRGGQFALEHAPAGSRRPAAGAVIQSAVERSAADPIDAMMRIQNAASAAGAATRIAQIHDELMGRAINSLGRVNT